MQFPFCQSLLYTSIVYFFNFIIHEWFSIYFRKALLTFLSVFVNSEYTRVPTNLESILEFGRDLLITALCIVLADHRKLVNLFKSRLQKCSL